MPISTVFALNGTLWRTIEAVPVNGFSTWAKRYYFTKYTDCTNNQQIPLLIKELKP